MIIDRDVYQGGVEIAQKRVSFCLDQLVKARNFRKGITWETSIVDRLSLEEIIGALVSAEQELEDL